MNTITLDFMWYEAHKRIFFNAALKEFSLKPSTKAIENCEL